MKSAQQIFDIAKKHLLKQNRRCTDDQGFCLYRSAGGLKCAVGVLIPDDEYHENMEHHMPRVLPRRPYHDKECSTNVKNRELLNDALRAGGVDVAEHQDLLLMIQVVHDAEVPEDWPLALKKLAARQSLIY
jgi:hypothetical protein